MPPPPPRFRLVFADIVFTFSSAFTPCLFRHFCRRSFQLYAFDYVFRLTTRAPAPRAAGVASVFARLPLMPYHAAAADATHAVQR
jgi:hypothetical protein